VAVAAAVRAVVVIAPADSNWSRDMKKGDALRRPFSYYQLVALFRITN
jgi:hypothetical protein